MGNMTNNKKEALMKAKQMRLEQRQYIANEIQPEMPGFSLSNLMSVRKRIIALKEQGVDMYRIRCFGSERHVKYSPPTGRTRIIKVKVMNVAAFNKFASILLANKEMMAWFKEVTHEPTWETFFQDIAKLAKKKNVIETWSAAEWHVVRNRYTSTVELVNSLSVKFLGAVIGEASLKTCEVTALFNKETYYFRWVNPQQAWDECKDINSRYKGHFCVGGGTYQEQMKSGQYHGYIVDKTVDAKTGTDGNGNKFSFGFVLTAGGGVSDWGFGNENRWDGQEEQLAKQVFGDAKLNPNGPEEKWIRMILTSWYKMRKMTYNEWVSEIERITKFAETTDVYESGEIAHFGKREKVLTWSKTGKTCIQDLANGRAVRNTYLCDKGVFKVELLNRVVVTATGFVEQAVPKAKKYQRFYLTNVDSTTQAYHMLRYLQLFKAGDSNGMYAYDLHNLANEQSGTLWTDCNRPDLDWGYFEDEYRQKWETTEYGFLPHLAGLSFPEFKARYHTELVENKASRAVYSLKTKLPMANSELRAQVHMFDRIDMNLRLCMVQTDASDNKKGSSRKQSAGLDLAEKLFFDFGYDWMKTKCGFMLVHPEIAKANPHRMMTAEERAMLNCVDCNSKHTSTREGWDSGFKMETVSVGAPVLPVPRMEVD
jgi:hypothetical protein